MIVVLTHKRVVLSREFDQFVLDNIDWKNFKNKWLFSGVFLKNFYLALCLLWTILNEILKRFKNFTANLS